MRTVTWMVLGLTVLLMFGSGCQPWREKYLACNAELENLQGLFDAVNNDNAMCQQQKAELERQLRASENQFVANEQVVEHEQSALEEAGGVYDPDKGTITVTLESGVLFDSGKATLKPDSKTSLRQLTNIIKQEHSGKEVWVIGHTDTDPIKKSGWKDNWQLSTERALAVTRYLLTNGVDTAHLVAAGRSQFQPVSDDKTRNRRVEIVVYTW